MRGILVLASISALLLTPPPPHRPVSPEWLIGRTLRVPNGDGTELRIDAPSDEWEWRTLDDKTLWLCMLPGPGGYSATLSFGRVEHIPTRGQYKSELKEMSRRQQRYAKATLRLLVWEPSAVPEPGSVRYTIGTKDAEEPSVGYFTPHRYQLLGPLGTGIEAERFAAFVASYRIVASGGESGS